MEKLNYWPSKIGKVIFDNRTLLFVAGAFFQFSIRSYLSSDMLGAVAIGFLSVVLFWCCWHELGKEWSKGFDTCFKKMQDHVDRSKQEANSWRNKYKAEKVRK